MAGKGFTAPTTFHTHPPSMRHRLPVPSRREPGCPGLAPHPGLLPSFRLLLRMAKNCSRSSSTFKFSQQEALPAREKMPRGSWGLRAPTLWGRGALDLP